MPTKKQRNLTTTGYIVLGLLAVKPWTAYQLKQQVERGPTWFWPRSGNKLYNIPKDLVTRRYATAERGATGRRPRTVYRITDEGRVALQTWLAETSAPPSLEFEGLVRALFADQGDKTALQRTLHELENRVSDMQRFGAQLGEEYHDTGGPFPDRLHVNVLVFEFMWLYTEALREWAEWAISEVDQWDGTGPQPNLAQRHLARYAHVADVVATRTSPSDSQLRSSGRPGR